MPIICTSDLSVLDGSPHLRENGKLRPLSENERLWVYNALDGALTQEIDDVLTPMMTNLGHGVYHFSRAMQAPVMDVMRRGLFVDKFERNEFLGELDRDKIFIESRLNRMAEVIWGQGLNARSPKQLSEFFYRRLGIPPQYQKKKGSSGNLTTDRNALETVSNYFRAKPFVSHILSIREVSKLASTLRSEVDPDGRMRTSLNIAGTETGRLSSSQSAFGTGTNLQNITDRLRRIFVPAPGKKFAYIDLEQAEARVVGFLCWIYIGLRGYLDACESGDLHTNTSKMVWPYLDWTGNPKLDREIADRIFYRHF